MVDGGAAQPVAVILMGQNRDQRRWYQRQQQLQPVGEGLYRVEKILPDAVIIHGSAPPKSDCWAGAWRPYAASRCGFRLCRCLSAIAAAAFAACEDFEPLDAFDQLRPHFLHHRVGDQLNVGFGDMPHFAAELVFRCRQSSVDSPVDDHVLDHHGGDEQDGEAFRLGGLEWRRLAWVSPAS